MEPINTWNNRLENVLLEQKHKCSSYKWIHEEENKKYKTRNTYLNIITIVFVSSTATASSIAATVDISEYRMYNNIINILFPIILYITAILNSIQEFLKYEKQSEKHKLAAIRYTALYNNINRMLSLEPSQRQSPTDYFLWATKEYDNINSSSPSISRNISSKYEKKFGLISSIINCNNDEKDMNIVKIDNYTIDQSERFKYEAERFVLNSFNC